MAHTKCILIGVAVIVAAVLLASYYLDEPIEEVLPNQIEKVFQSTAEAIYTPEPTNYSDQVLERQLAINEQLKDRQETLEEQQAYNCTRHTGLDYC